MQSDKKGLIFVNLHYLIGFILCLILLCSPLPTWAAGINCSRAVSVVEKTICNNTDLKNLDESISEKYTFLLTKPNPDDKSLLRAGQGFWLRERNDCQNVPYQSGGMEAAVYLCVRQELEKREAFLKSAIANPSFIAKQAVIYRSIDPWYFEKYKDGYLDRKIAISGYVLLDSCEDKKADKRIGDIVGSDKMKTKVAIFFKSMPENEHYFLCEKTPLSSWEGEVRKINGKIVLYMDKVLGTKLP